MARISHLFPNTGNDYCPQTLFAYGAYKEDGTPNFGLFCWFSYCWTDNFGVMACIGEPKLTQDLIRKNRVFSANLITEKLLPLADYFGSTSGHSPDKMNIPFRAAGECAEEAILQSLWHAEPDIARDGSPVPSLREFLKTSLSQEWERRNMLL